jgi:hypothetical protein
VYDKTEDPALTTAVGAKEAGVEWDVLVTDDWQSWDRQGWKVVKRIEGLAGIERKGKWRIGVRWEDKIGILARSRPAS